MAPSSFWKPRQCTRADCTFVSKRGAVPSWCSRCSRNSSRLRYGWRSNVWFQPRHRRRLPAVAALTPINCCGVHFAGKISGMKNKPRGAFQGKVAPPGLRLSWGMPSAATRTGRCGRLHRPTTAWTASRIGLSDRIARVSSLSLWKEGQLLPDPRPDRRRHWS